MLHAFGVSTSSIIAKSTAYASRYEQWRKESTGAKILAGEILTMGCPWRTAALKQLYKQRLRTQTAQRHQLLMNDWYQLDQAKCNGTFHVLLNQLSEVSATAARWWCPLLPPVPLPWCTDLLRGCGKWNLFQAREKQRPVVLRDRLMHYRAVSVTLNVSLKALDGFTPRHFADFFTGHFPLVEACEMLGEAGSNFMTREGYEGVAKAWITLEVYWKIDKVEAACKAFGVHEIQQHLAREIVW